LKAGGSNYDLVIPSDYMIKRMIDDDLIEPLDSVWSRDGFYCMGENPDLDYVIPKEGSNLWFDAMVIPKGAEHKKTAEQFINFMCETDIAYRNADYIGYASPHLEAVKKLPSAITGNRAAYPLPEDLKDCEVFSSLGKMLKEFDRIWTEVKSE
jgi:spermidine/putrescine transport system substrate-binding protein